MRSSANAEDRPDASFAGQQETVLNAQGADELLGAVRTCWDSLDSDRAIAYRQAHGIERGSARMAVLVQRMITSRVAGVLFTANPVTCSRSEVVIDAAPGSGDAVVAGSVEADHYVLDATVPRTTKTAPEQGGCLRPDELEELRAAGTRLHEHFGAPQDLEWAIDDDGVLWLLQSRPTTTLFPAPPETTRPKPRVYLEGGTLQGMLRPFTPMGMSAIRRAATILYRGHGANTAADEQFGAYVDVGGRLYVDVTEAFRSKRVRASLPRSLAVYGPQVSAIAENLVRDPRFRPRRQIPFRPRSVLAVTLRNGAAAVAGLTRAWFRPAAARAEAFAQVDKIKHAFANSSELTSTERLSRAEEAQRPVMGERGMAGLMWPLIIGMLAGELPRVLLSGLATEAELTSMLGGVPHNVTTEMDLALWQVASRAEPHRDLLVNTSPSELATRYRNGELPEIGLDDFLDKYGHRAAGEIDVGIPRWGEDPAPVFATIANYLRATSAEQALARRFEQAAAEPRSTARRVLGRARRTRPIRAWLAELCLRRSRELTGLRELPKFAWLYTLREMREQLKHLGADLASRGVLAEPDDIMFVTLDEAHEALNGGVSHDLIASRKAVHARESRRRDIPAMLLSDGTILERTLPHPETSSGVLSGLAASPGVVTARARVVHDPSQTRIEPGEILVAPTTDPGWTPLFMTAGGLVTETGARMAHGPTVARENGIPAVICVPGATRAIETGQLLHLDGATGTVTVEPSAS